MKQSPILFSKPMVQAIMNGSKIQTRRLTNLKEVNRYPNHSKPIEINNGMTEDEGWGVVFDHTHNFQHRVKSPYGYIGDIIWVRETTFKNGDEFVYRADGECCEQFEQCECAEIGKPKWTPSIHMVKEACRLYLKITNLTVQRLHDITNEDVVKEGVDLSCTPGAYFIPWSRLWIEINGQESWDINPWVWVIDFHKTVNPNE